MSDPPAAFELKANHDLDSVGTVFINDQLEVNVREQLQAGNGYLQTTDPAVTARLDSYEPLKRASTADAEQASKPKSGKPANSQSKEA